MYRMLAEDYLNPEEPLLIAGCDNGMDIDRTAYESLTESVTVLSLPIAITRLCWQTPMPTAG